MKLKIWHVWTILIIGLSILIINAFIRNKEISDSGISSVAYLYKIEKNVSRGTTSTRDITFFYYYFNNKKIRFYKEILNDNVVPNKCYKIIFSPKLLTSPDVYFNTIIKCPSEFDKK